MRKFALLSVALMVVLAGCGSFTGTSTPEATETATPTPGDGTPTPTETPTQTPEPDENTSGYVNGVWYNQSLDVNTDDGLDQEELDKLKYRTMARLEVIRGLQFEEDVPVEVKTREEYQQELEEDGTFDSSENEQVHQNVKWRASFLVDKDTDAMEELKAFYAGGVLGYYDPAADEIVVISPSNEDGVPSGLDEMTLAHELAHALQDQHFNISQSKFRGATTESDNAVSGLVEGDAHYMEHLYQQRCQSAEWECLERPDDRGGGGDYNIGLWATQYAPYSEGPTLIQQRHENQGWEAVNEMYENPPASTAQLIHHEKYPGEKPSDVTIEDRSSDAWSVPEIEGGINYASYGEAGLYVMFWYPSYEATQSSGQLTNVVIDYQDFFNFQGPGGELAPIGPYDYSHEITDGWDGDKLLPYANDAGETGFVWKLQWESDQDAQQFVDAYRQLLQHHGAEQIDSDTYRISDGGFEGAYSISKDGSTVVIVNAPSTDQLGEVREGAGS
ncbi:hypothetical protein BRC81_17065 [Halobacteriales archaeon QS_1_68_20]|nr:MAG: hypothetical protein BRC81_17065 [Halobacteriales archaeon QS_1_68_20]